jgi:hypothetical protein
MRKILLGVLVLSGLLVLVGVAKADMIGFDISIGNSAIGGFAEPYATVLVNRTSTTTATITVDSVGSYWFGKSSGFAFNTSAGSVIFSDFSTAPKSIGSGNVSEFGKMQYTFDFKAKLTDVLNHLSFDITGGSGTNWTSAASVLAADNKGYLAAAHILVPTNDNAPPMGFSATGYAGNGAPHVVPIPGAVWLLGSGILGLVGLKRKYLA